MKPRLREEDRRWFWHVLSDVLATYTDVKVWLLCYLWGRFGGTCSYDLSIDCPDTSEFVGTQREHKLHSLEDCLRVCTRWGVWTRWWFTERFQRLCRRLSVYNL